MNKQTRLDVIDMLRGFVIVVMALDHVRDYFHADALAFDPTDLTRTTAALFATRWITHLCAPTFVFLAGASIFLQGWNGKPPATLSRFLLTRGLWLIVLELTVIAFSLNFALPFVFLQVIWAIGCGMVLLAALIWLPRVVVLWIGALIVAGYAALPAIDVAALGKLGMLWQLGMQFGPLPEGLGFVAYPAIPWLGVMCLGYGLGFVFVLDTLQRRRAIMAMGLAAIVLFVAVRAFDGYGEPQPWSLQNDALFTFLSFINVSKYPPSFLFVLITLGVSLLLTPMLERLKGPLGNALLAFGRTPLFTFVLHLYLIHGLAMIVGVAMGIPASHFVNYLGDPSRLAAAGWGFGLPIVYGVWLLVLITLWPLSRWFAAIKQRRRDTWLSYL